MTIKESYIEDLIDRPLDLDTDITEYVDVAIDWHACEEAIEELMETYTLASVDPWARGEYLRWFYAEASYRCEGLGRWHAAEPLMKDNMGALADYMVRLPDRHDDLEQMLLEGNTTAHALVGYAGNKRPNRDWPEIEPLLLRTCIGDRFASAIRYAVFIMRRRWPELEARLTDEAAERYFNQLEYFGHYIKPKSETTT